MEIIDKANFVSIDHASYIGEGIRSYVDVARLLLELKTIVKTMAKGNITSFHVHERALYTPLKEVLDSNLPSREFVSIENLLYKTKKPKQQTDLSLRKISNLTKDRLAADLDCTHFIEIKSVFSGESLSGSDIEKDLKKLVACETAYGAVCFFVLVGLQGDLSRNKNNLKLLGVLGKNKTAFSVQTTCGETIWLRPAGSDVVDDPLVFIWEVSTTNKFTGQRRSGCTFSVFQEKTGHVPNPSFYRTCAKNRAGR